MPVPPVPVAANPHEYWLILAQASENVACTTRATCDRRKGRFLTLNPAKVDTHCVPKRKS